MTHWEEFLLMVGEEFLLMVGGGESMEKVKRHYMSDPPQGDTPAAADADKRGRGATDPIIDNAIDRLRERVVSQPDRGKLRDALDKADAPLTGREGANEALGRISKR